MTSARAAKTDARRAMTNLPDDGPTPCGMRQRRLRYSSRVPLLLFNENRLVQTGRVRRDRDERWVAEAARRVVRKSTTIVAPRSPPCNRARVKILSGQDRVSHPARHACGALLHREEHALRTISQKVLESVQIRNCLMHDGHRSRFSTRSFSMLVRRSRSSCSSETRRHPTEKRLLLFARSR